MAKLVLHEKALEMRRQGLSYSQIKETIPVSKSTLSLWLRDLPLSSVRIYELQGKSERRIEKCRETKKQNHEARQRVIYKEVSEKIGKVIDRELFLAGIFLYWAEGTKASRGSIQFTNTDPSMIRLFIQWLLAQGKTSEQILVKLHLYADMDIETETTYWSKELNLPRESFRKPYIKESFANKRNNYKGRFGHGTCNLIVYDTALYDLLMNGIKYIVDSRA